MNIIVAYFDEHWRQNVLEEEETRATFAKFNNDFNALPFQRRENETRVNF